MRSTTKEFLVVGFWLWAAHAAATETCTGDYCYQAGFPYGQVPVAVAVTEEKDCVLTRHPKRETGALWCRDLQSPSWRRLELPKSELPFRALCLTADGLPWVASAESVHAHDGQGWRTSPGPERPPYGLHCNGGRVYATSEYNHDLFRLDGTEWSRLEYPKDEEGDSVGVYWIGVDDQGQPWIVSSVGIRFFGDGRWQAPPVAPLVENDLLGSGGYGYGGPRFDRLPGGALVLPNGETWAWNGKGFEPLPPPPEPIHPETYGRKGGTVAVIGSNAKDPSRRRGWLLWEGGWKPLRLGPWAPSSDLPLAGRRLLLEGPEAVLSLAVDPEASEAGAVVRFSTASEPVPVNPRFLRLVTLEDGGVVALGENGRLAWRVEAGWGFETVPGGGMLTAAEGRSREDFWVGGDGFLWHRTADGWQKAPGCDEVGRFVDLARDGNGRLFGITHSGVMAVTAHLVEIGAQGCVVRHSGERGGPTFGRITRGDGGHLVLWNREGGWRWNGETLEPLPDSAEVYWKDQPLRRAGTDVWSFSGSDFIRWREGRKTVFSWPMAADAQGFRLVSVTDFLPGREGPEVAAGPVVDASGRWAGGGVARLADEGWVLEAVIPGLAVNSLAGTPSRLFFAGDSGLLGAGAPPEAEKEGEVARVDELQQQAAQAITRGDWKGALELLEQAQKLQPDPRREDRILRIRTYLERSDASRAK